MHLADLELGSERDPLRAGGGESQSAGFSMQARRRGVVLGVCAICLFAVAAFVKPNGAIALMEPDLRVSIHEFVSHSFNFSSFLSFTKLPTWTFRNLSACICENLSCLFNPSNCDHFTERLQPLGRHSSSRTQLLHMRFRSLVPLAKKDSKTKAVSN
jgi:hypothetical protein